MPEMDFFPQRPESHPTVYAYEFVGVASHKGYIKVGYTERDVDTRIKEQLLPNSSGMQRCVLAKPLHHTSLLRRWGSRGF